MDGKNAVDENSGTGIVPAEFSCNPAYRGGSILHTEKQVVGAGHNEDGVGIVDGCGRPVDALQKAGGRFTGHTPVFDGMLRKALLPVEIFDE